MDLPEKTSLWWNHHHHQQQQPMLLLEPIQNTTWSHQHQNDVVLEEKEAMFEKPLTPSDVGKLNRLVIPKQYAEKYFPLGGGDSVESCKGLLLSFEDESGKCWRFRYSYWNSSQSYVLTKGWSRYVKDKRLDAGDVILFQRCRVDSQRLFIHWRRRGGGGGGDSVQSAYVGRGNGGKNEVVSGSGGGWSSRGFYSTHPSYPAHHQQLLPYQQFDTYQCLHAGRVSESENQRTKEVENKSNSSSSSSSKVLRLFGVNMECQPQHDSTPQCSSYDNMTSTHQDYNYNQPNNSNSNSTSHVVQHQQYYF